MADDFTLKWDAQNQELYGEDPSTGDRIPVPFDSVNTNSVNTGELNNDGNPISLLDALNFDIVSGDPASEAFGAIDDDVSSLGVKMIAAGGISVSTSSTELVSNTLNTAVVFVSGTDVSSNRFIDRVGTCSFDTPTKEEIDTRNSPPARSYSQNSGALEMSVSSGSYTVSLFGIKFDVVD